MKNSVLRNRVSLNIPLIILNQSAMIALRYLGLCDEVRGFQSTDPAGPKQHDAVAHTARQGTTISEFHWSTILDRPR